MIGKKECSLVRELLPLYKDKLVGKESNNIIEEHLKECKDCRGLLNNIRQKEDEDFKKNESTRYAKIAKKIKRRKIIIIISTIILILAISVTGIKLFNTVVISGDSMKPTVSNGDKYFVNKLVYKVSNPKTLDIIIYEYSNSYYISRIIGISGETIEIKQGNVYVNNKKLEYEFLPKTINVDKIKLEKDQYFVVQDNPKAISEAYRIVKKDEIIGKIYH